MFLNIFTASLFRLKLEKKFLELDDRILKNQNMKNFVT